jgi:hypothetical protein
VAILETKTTNSVSLNSASTDGFKDWQDEEGKQVIITKILFGLFDESTINKIKPISALPVALEL